MTLRDRPGAPEGNQNAKKDKYGYKPSIRRIELKGGTNAAYTIARLNRDNPELAERDSEFEGPEKLLL